jgi:membrane-bound inhibitor of C-type lysozyme
MKPLAFVLVLFASLPGGLRAQAGNVASVSFKGHFIGEGVADFLRIEPEAQQEVDVCRQRPTRRSCDRILGALNAGGRAEMSTTGSINFVLDGGKLVKLTMLVDKPMDAATSELTQKFGPQTKVTILPAQSASGAKWDNRLYIWETPSAYITLYQDNNPSMQDHRLLLMAESHAEHLLEDMDSPKRPISLAGTVDSGKSVKTVFF